MITDVQPIRRVPGAHAGRSPPGEGLRVTGATSADAIASAFAPPGSAAPAGSAIARPAALAFGPTSHALPAELLRWLDARGLGLDRSGSADGLVAAACRGRPRAAIIDARHGTSAALDVLRRLKRDAFTAVVPTVLLVPASAPAALAAGFADGADEVLADGVGTEGEWPARLDALLARSDRDTGVHPSTRLPGAPAIEVEYGRRIAAGERFAVCYVDVDHFKEFNDRYSYRSGDRVIRVLANILHDVVRGRCGTGGFVGHIGGDDFICVVPADAATLVCEEVVELFDTLIPFQYSAPDRATGYYFGKDRRGQLHRVPLMTVSIGVVTNGRREFTSPAQISELATEMKSYAKTFTGSVYVVDRRHDAALAPTATVDRGGR